MKRLNTVKILLAVAVIVLCAGAAFCSLMRLHSVEQRSGFNLYALVPQDVVAVFETDRLMDFFHSVGHMQCNADGHRLQTSGLFGSLGHFLQLLSDEAPHALSAQMNKVLVSFHGSGSSSGQVLYVSLAAGDRERIEDWFERYSRALSFPVKGSVYSGKEIRVCPLKDGRFLAICLTNKFLVASFQKKLVEQAVDTYLGEHSLLQESVFQDFRKDKHNGVPATLYLRVRSVSLGQPADSIRAVTRWGDWMELDLTVEHDALYGVGVCHTSEYSVASSLPRIFSGWGGDVLPASTSLYTVWSVSADNPTLPIPISPFSFSTEVPAYAARQDSAFIRFLHECGASRIASCVFRPEESEGPSAPCAVSVVSLPDTKRAQSLFFRWLQSVPRRKAVRPVPRFEPMYERYPHSFPFRKYLLPPATLFFKLTGMEGTSFYSYACFYRDRLLLAADARSLSAYIESMESGDTLEGVAGYGVLTGTLASSGLYLLMADMDAVSQLPSSYVRLLPTFFLKHISFFRHFLLAVQFTRQGELLIPNLTLLYRAGEQDGGSVLLLD